MIPTDLEGVFQNGGFYDPIQYRDWRYPKVSRNRWEGEQEASVADVDAGENQPLLEGGIEMDAIAARGTPASQLNDGNPDEESDDLLVRHFRPRYLCFLRDGPRGPDTAYETWKVTDWIRKHGDYAGTDFVFISYTRKQFLISAETKWSRGQPAPDEATKAAYRRLAEADRASVLACGMEAARSVAKRAFWVDFECIRDADDTARATAQSDDVYRICDIVRAAHSLVILLGPPHETRLLLPPGQAHQRDYDAASMDRWLQEWGSRLWTLPEILLCSAERRVKLYAVGAAKAPEEIAKRNIAARVSLARREAGAAADRPLQILDPPDAAGARQHRAGVLFVAADGPVQRRRHLLVRAHGAAAEAAGRQRVGRELRGLRPPLLGQRRRRPARAAHLHAADASRRPLAQGPRRLGRPALGHRAAVSDRGHRRRPDGHAGRRLRRYDPMGCHGAGGVSEAAHVEPSIWQDPAARRAGVFDFRAGPRDLRWTKLAEQFRLGPFSIRDSNRHFHPRRPASHSLGAGHVADPGHASQHLLGQILVNAGAFLGAGGHPE